MSEPLSNHPSQEQLTDFALGLNGAGIAEHVAACEECARIVRDIRGVKKTLGGLPDEDPPESLRQKILERRQATKPAGLNLFSFSGKGWLRTIILIIAGFLVLVFCLYYLIAFKL
jgi:hypothetical protein